MTTRDSLTAWMGDRDTEGGGLEAEAMLAQLRRRMFDRSDAVVCVGKYRDLVEIGRGGMSVVYRGRDEALQREVAIKLLRSDTFSSPHRLRREARAMARLSHPNVVQVLEVGQHEGETFVVMELVKGTDAAAWLAQADPPWDAVLRVFLAAGEGLAAAHAEGLVHRDFKPSNVMVGDEGRVCVTDFGLARPLGAGQSVPSLEAAESSGDLDDEVTATGARVGTPRYMAPEQRDGGRVDHRADQWAFAASLWEALHGRHPLADDAGRIDPTRITPSVPSERREVPRAIRRVLGIALRRAPERRHASMHELLARLRAAARGRRGWVPLLGGLAVAGVAALGFMSAPSSALHCDPTEHSATTWNPTRRMELARAFAATELPFADRAWTEVDARLAPWVESWNQEFARVCLAADSGRSEPERDRQLLCLRGQLSELNALLELLEHADRTLVGRAERATRDLPRPSACRDPGSTSSIDTLVLATHTERMAEIRALARAGHYGNAATLAEQAVEASATEPALLSEAHFSLGMNRKRSGDAETSGDPLRAAFYGAAASEDAALATSAALALLNLSHRRSEQDEAEQWSRHAATWLGRMEPGPKLVELQREFGLGQADLLSGVGKFDEAMVELERVWALCDYDERSPLAPRLFNEMGMVQLELGEYERAKERLSRSVELESQRSGRDHPQVANALTNLGSAHWFQADYGAAERAYREAYEIRMATLGPGNPKTAIAVMNLGLLAQVRGDYEGALEHFERAIEGLTASFGHDHPQTALAISNVAATLSSMGEWERSNVRNREALEIYVERLGPEHPKVANSLHNLASGLTEVGRYTEAIELHERALVIVEKVHGRSHVFYASGLHNIAVVLRRMNEYERAELRDREALLLYERALGPEHPELALVLLGLAQNALEDERFGEAIALAERARAVKPLAAANRGLAAFFLAQGLWSAGLERSRVPALLDEAQRELEEAKLAGTDNLTDLHRWRATHLD